MPEPILHAVTTAGFLIPRKNLATNPNGMLRRHKEHKGSLKYFPKNFFVAFAPSWQSSYHPAAAARKKSRKRIVSQRLSTSLHRCQSVHTYSTPT